MTTAAAARASWPARKKRREQARARTARLIQLAKPRYIELIDKLGGKCVFCGATWDDLPLTVHHGQGRTWEARRVRFDLRVKRYWEEHEAGVDLQVACLPCNSRDANNHKGKNRRY